MATFGAWFEGLAGRPDDAGAVAMAWRDAKGQRPKVSGLASVTSWVTSTLVNADQGWPLTRLEAAMQAAGQEYREQRAHLVTGGKPAPAAGPSGQWQRAVEASLAALSAGVAWCAAALDVIGISQLGEQFSDAVDQLVAETTEAAANLQLDLGLAADLPEPGQLASPGIAEQASAGEPGTGPAVPYQPGPPQERDAHGVPIVTARQEAANELLLAAGRLPATDPELGEAVDGEPWQPQPDFAAMAAAADMTADQGEDE